MPPKKTELVSFAVMPGMEATADEWLRVLHERQAECVGTLDRERMHYESVFKIVRNGRMYLSWFSVQGHGASHVESSPHEIDQLHMEYWRKCIDASTPPEVHEHVVSFVPKEVSAAIEERNAL